MNKIGASVLMLMSLSANAADQLPAVVAGAMAGAVAGAVAGATPNTGQGEVDDKNLSSDCVKSISRLYRFYFHEIYPNPKNEACQKPSEPLGPEETAEMQSVIGNLRSNCPMNVVAQITGSFKELTEERDA
jgi:hypothetical protein